jgi:hypothetical protein
MDENKTEHVPALFNPKRSKYAYRLCVNRNIPMSILTKESHLLDFRLPQRRTEAFPLLGCYTA